MTIQQLLGSEKNCIKKNERSFVHAVFCCHGKDPVGIYTLLQSVVQSFLYSGEFLTSCRIKSTAD